MKVIKTIYDIKPPLERGGIMEFETEQEMLDYEPAQRIIDLRGLRGRAYTINKEYTRKQE